MAVVLHRNVAFCLVAFAIVSLVLPVILPNVSSSGSTLFSDNFDSDQAIAGPVYSWNRPAGANKYEPPTSVTSYPKYQSNLYSVYVVGGSDVCTKGRTWDNSATLVNSPQGKLSGTYYLAVDLNFGGAGSNNWNGFPSAVFAPNMSGEVMVTVAAPNNAISLTLKLPSSNPLGGHTGGYNTINFYRVFITPTSGAEATGSDYFNVTFPASPPYTTTFTIYSLSTASTGTHGTGGEISQCDPWPPSSQYVLGPNAIFAVTSERAHSGSNSLLMGASDLGYDKTSTSIRLLGSAIPYPSLNYVQFSYAVWMSGDINHGTCFNANNSTSSSMLEVVGNALTYRCNQAGTPGVWKNAQTLLGTYYMSTQQWHVISVTFDVSILGGTFYDLTIDGVEPTWVTGGTNPLRGMPAQFSKYLMDSKGNWAFAFWLNTQGITNLSRATAKSNGAYVYIDDISIVLLPHQ